MPSASSQSQAASNPQGGPETQANAIPDPQTGAASAGSNSMPAADAQAHLESSLAASTGTKRVAAVAVVDSEAGDAHRLSKRGRNEQGPDQACFFVSSVSEMTAARSAEWLCHIQKHIEELGGESSLELLERIRYKMLADACVKSDVMYLVLHQLFCLWALDGEAARSFLQPYSKVADSTFKLLSFALQDNSRLSAETLRWFSSFPLQGDVSEWRRQGYPREFRVMLETPFMRYFARTWGSLMERLEARKYPFLVWEMKDLLFCTSPILRDVLFTSSRRRLGFTDDTIMRDLIQELHQIYARDCKNESRTAPGNHDTFQARGSTINHYKHLHTLLTTLRPVPPSRLPRQVLHGFVTDITPSDHVVTAAQMTETLPAAQPTHTSGAAITAHHATHQTFGTPGASMSPRQHAQGRLATPRVHPPPTPNCQPAIPFSVPLSPGMGPVLNHGAMASPVVWSPHAPPPANTPLAWQPSLPDQYPHLAGAGQRHVHYPLQVMQQAAANGHSPAMYYAVSSAQTTRRRMTPLGAGNQWLQPLGNPTYGYRFIDRSTTYNAQQQVGIHFDGQAPWLTQQQAISPVNHHQPVLPSQELPSGHYAQANLQGSPHPRASLQGPSPPANLQSPRPQANLPADANRSQHSVVPLADTEYPRSEYDWTSLQFSLHLVHTRSPRRAPAELNETRYFQFVEHFAVEPVELVPRRGVRSLRFSLSQGQLDAAVSLSPGLGVATFSNRSTRYRLRVCRRNRHAVAIKGTAWAVSPTFWPPHIFLEFNGQSVYPRRKQHHHHDVPIELSGLLRCGENLVRASLPEDAGNVGDGSLTYYIAVEVVSTCDFAMLVAGVEAREHVCLDHTRKEFGRRLGQSVSDDVMIQDDTLRVAVTDPFSSSLFSTPVRGLDCKHLECFDLQIWLQTRQGKPSKALGEPSLVDSWKCPICSLDARPISLRVDDFFVDVRKKLIASGSGDTKYILVKADGSWTAAEEPRDAEDDGPSGFDAARAVPPAQESRQSTGPATVIVLDDD